jgi:hypothetical protein
VTTDVQLAGKLADLGNSWLGTLGTWGDKGLQVGLTAIVVITFVRKVSTAPPRGALMDTEISWVDRQYPVPDSLPAPPR